MLCESLEGSLLKIDSSHEERFICEYVAESTNPVWLGLVNQNKTKENLGKEAAIYRWLDNTEMIYTNWADAAYPFTNRDATMFWPLRRAWYLTNFDQSHRVICERQINHTAELTHRKNSIIQSFERILEIKNKEPKSATLVVNYWIKPPKIEKEYFLVDKVMAFDDASNLAVTNNARLLKVTSQEENDFIRVSLEADGKFNYVWLGMLMKDGVHKWMDDSLLSYSNWNELSLLRNKTSKGAVFGPCDGQWHVGELSASRRVILERDFTSKEEVGPVEREEDGWTFLAC